MCLILLACNQHPEYPLILAANRDEYFDRPSGPLQFWDENPEVLAGKDLEKGGSWLGVNRGGKLAAVTNYHPDNGLSPGARSRGLLVKHYLYRDFSAMEYLQVLAGESGLYNGFNILLYDLESCYFFSNYVRQPVKLSAGFHGVSNGALTTPWPKVSKGIKGMEQVLKSGRCTDPEAYFELLSNRTVPEDQALPDTGTEVELERKLAPIFVRGERYGTRSSSVIIYDNRKHISFSERTYHQDGTIGQTLYFTITSSGAS
jgi:uncharacterized protein with NRDE domain